MEKTIITVQVSVKAPIEKVWKCWTTPDDITRWNHASDDWHTPSAELDLRPGGVFKSRMESRDGKMGFDFEGIFDTVVPYENIVYTIGDGRKVMVRFSEIDGRTAVSESFEAESTHSIDLQRDGWQSILNNFGKYVETKS